MELIWNLYMESIWNSGTMTFILVNFYVWNGMEWDRIQQKWNNLQNIIRQDPRPKRPKQTFHKSPTRGAELLSETKVRPTSLCPGPYLRHHAAGLWWFLAMGLCVAHSTISTSKNFSAKLAKALFSFPGTLWSVCEVLLLAAALPMKIHLSLSSAFFYVKDGQADFCTDSPTGLQLFHVSPSCLPLHTMQRKWGNHGSTSLNEFFQVSICFFLRNWDIHGHTT